MPWHVGACTELSAQADTTPSSCCCLCLQSRSNSSSDMDSPGLRQHIRVMADIQDRWGCVVVEWGAGAGAACTTAAGSLVVRGTA